MKKNISIHDIAKHLQVSATTVSFVLNGKAESNKIRKEVVERIQAYVKEVGYRPNLNAKSLRTGKSHIIGMLVEGISDPYFAAIARLVESEIYKLGYKLIYASTDNNTEKAQALISAFRERQVDCFIMAPPPGIEADIQALLDENCPVILFDRFLPSIKTTNVVIDNYKGTYDAIIFLIENGYKNIGFVTVVSDQVQMADRLKGYKDALKSKKLSQAILKVPYSLDNEENIVIVKEFIVETAPLDALFFATNYLTIDGLRALKSLKRSIPESLALISFDDNSHYELFSPSVTAVAQPIEDISKAIIQQIQRKLINKNVENKNETIVLETKLVIRESTPVKQSTLKKIKRSTGTQKTVKTKQVEHNVL